MRVGPAVGRQGGYVLALRGCKMSARSEGGQRNHRDVLEDGCGKVGGSASTRHKLQRLVAKLP